MSAKVLTTFEDESPDLRKQLGCISVLFHVFDRQRLVSKKRIAGHIQKDLIPSGNSGSESSGCSTKPVVMKTSIHNQNHRLSSESSRNSSSSSSSSSSFSSIECSKPLQQQSPLVDFRDVVKDAIYREGHALSVKTEASKDKKKMVVKNKDSPRPLPFSKSNEDSRMVSGKSRVLVESEDLPSVLAKLKGEPWQFEFKPKEHTRFSCDGREVSQGSLDSQEKRMLAKLKEMPRFSLDSRQSSLNEVEKRESDLRVVRTLALHQEFGENKMSPGVVARLMGLEALPIHGKDVVASNGQKRNISSFNSPRVYEDPKQVMVSSPKVSSKESSSNARMPIETTPWNHHDNTGGPAKKQESVYAEIARKLNELEFQQSNKDLRALKQILDAIRSKGFMETKKPNSKLPEATRNQQTQAHGDPDSLVKDERYQQGKRNHKDPPIMVMKPAISVNKCRSPSRAKPPVDGLHKVPTGDSNDGKRASYHNSQLKYQVQKNASRDGDFLVHNSLEKISSARRHQSSSDGSLKNASISSPRTQQKMIALERKSRSEARKKQQKPSSQTTESASPRPKVGMEPKAESKLDMCLSQTTSKIRNLKSREGEISPRSDSNVSLASQMDSDVASLDQSPKLPFAFFHGNQRPSEISVATAGLNTKHKDLGHYHEDCSTVGKRGTTIEQPSPVSVLNMSFYRDESPASPIDGSSLSCGDDGDGNTEDAASADGWNSMASTKHLPSVPNHDELELNKLGNIACLVQKLQQLSSKDDIQTELNQFASFHEAKKQDYFYISEVLLAAGLLLKDLSLGFQLLPNSGHPINPELFLVLEQKLSELPIMESITTDASRRRTNHEMLHRKLLFDTMNEIVAGKLELSCTGITPLASFYNAGKIAHRTPSGKHLLKELCFEIEQLERISLQASGNLQDEVDDGLKPLLSHDISHNSEGWSHNGKEVSRLVLDMERSIFKDLIDEVVNGEVPTFLQARARTSTRRQLYAK